MTKEELLDKVLSSYRAYYDVNTETPEEPFAAEAVFVYGLSNASANLESSNSFDANFLLILDFLNNLLTSAISSNSFIADSNPFLLEDLSPPEKAFINTSDILLPSIDFPIFLYSSVL